MAIQVDGFVIEGKNKGCKVWANLSDSNKLLSIYTGVAPDYSFFLNEKSVIDTQEMGSVSHSADPTDVLKAGFWFGGAGAIAATELGKSETHTVAIEYVSGERSLINLYTTKAYQAFKRLEFIVNEEKRKKQLETPNTPDGITDISNNSIEPNDQAVPDKVQVAKRQIHINTENIQASLIRAFLFLEDEEWETADEYFESILDVDPECGEAYLGKLLVELRLPVREELVNLADFPVNNKWYKKALRFGSEELIDELQGYQNKIIMAEKESEQFIITNQSEQLYRLAEEARKKNTVHSLYKASYLFESSNEFKDAKEKSAECKDKIRQILQMRKDDQLALTNAEKFLSGIDLFPLEDETNSGEFDDKRINEIKIYLSEAEKEKNDLDQELKSLGLFKKNQKQEIQNKISDLILQIETHTSELNLLERNREIYFQRKKDIQEKYLSIFNSRDPKIIEQLEKIYQYGVDLLNKSCPRAAHYIFSKLQHYKNSKMLLCRSAEMILQLYNIDDLGDNVAITKDFDNGGEDYDPVSVAVSNVSGIRIYGDGQFDSGKYDSMTDIVFIGDADFNSQSNRINIYGVKENGNAVCVGELNNKFDFSSITCAEKIGYWDDNDYMEILHWNPWMDYYFKENNIKERQFFRVEKMFYNETEFYGFSYLTMVSFSTDDCDYELGLRRDGKIDLFKRTYESESKTAHYQPLAVRKINKDFDFSDWDNMKRIEVGYIDSQYFLAGINQDGSVVATGEIAFDREELKNWNHIKEVYPREDGLIAISESGKLYFTNNAFGKYHIVLTEVADFDFSNLKKIEIYYSSFCENAYIIGLTKNYKLIGAFSSTTESYKLRTQLNDCGDIIDYSTENLAFGMIAVKSDGSLCYVITPCGEEIKGIEKIKLF